VGKGRHFHLQLAERKKKKRARKTNTVALGRPEPTKARERGEGGRHVFSFAALQRNGCAKREKEGKADAADRGSHPGPERRKRKKGRVVAKLHLPVLPVKEGPRKGRKEEKKRTAAPFRDSSPFCLKQLPLIGRREGKQLAGNLGQ